MKKVKAVEPYIYKGQLNFKQKPFDAWKASPNPSRRGETLPVVRGHYPRFLHKLMFKFDLAGLFEGFEWFQKFKSSREARLVFVQPVTLYFDTFFVAPFHEMIPMVWDCWEEYDDMMVKWLKRHKIKKAIFTSEISAGRIKARVPELDILVITEGIDCENYPKGKELKDRSIDVFNYGRLPKWAEDFNRLGDSLSLRDPQPKGVNIGKEGNVSSLSYMSQESKLNVVYGGTDEEFSENLQNAKVTITIPRSDVNPKCHETLTQRYWECMLSRMVMVGRAPKELIDLIGYNPIASPSPSRRGDVDYYQFVQEVVENIEDYQELVDRNREVALRMAPWEIRVKRIIEWLNENGYSCLV